MTLNSFWSLESIFERQQSVEESYDRIKKDKYFVFISFSAFIVNVEGSYNFDLTYNEC